MIISPEIALNEQILMNKVLTNRCLQLAQQLFDVSNERDQALVDRDAIREERDEALADREAIRTELDALIMEQKEERPADAAE